MYTVPETAQRGVVLVFALLVLLMLSLLVTTVMRGSMMQLRMARNVESAAQERLQALGEIERILQYLGLEAPAGPRGYRHCTLEQEGCDSISLSGMSEPARADFASVRVVSTDLPPPRLNEASASSGLAYRAVRYEVGAVAGETTLVQGLEVLVPVSHR